MSTDVLLCMLTAPMAISVSLNRSTQSIYWTVTNLKSKQVMMSCSRDGKAGLGKGSSVQGGAYRRVMDDGSTKPAIAMVGNFIVTRGHWGTLVK